MAGDQPEQVVKRWVGYVCPECHMIFRIEVGHGGRRAQCPGCHALVILGGRVAESPVELRPAASEPPEEAETPSITEPAIAREVVREESPLDEDTDGAPVADGMDAEAGDDWREPRKRIKKWKEGLNEPEWEQSKRKKKHRRTSWGTPVMLACLLISLGAGVAYWARSVAGWGRDDGVVRGSGLADDSVSGGGDGGVDLKLLLPDVEKVVGRFLAAETVDELLETVRDRERLEPAIRRAYADGYGPTLVRKIAPEGELQTVRDLYSVNVELVDFSRRPIAVEKTSDGILVDWESWVGHSEVPWDEFMRTRPTEPMVFRVKTQKLEYYNYDFSDDGKWQSFRLASPDNGHTLYGYVPRYSELEQKLKPLDPRIPMSTHTVMLRFPEDATRPDQVLVESVIASGWVVSDTEEQTNVETKEP